MTETGQLQEQVGSGVSDTLCFSTRRERQDGLGGKGQAGNGQLDLTWGSGHGG